MAKSNVHWPIDRDFPRFAYMRVDTLCSTIPCTGSWILTKGSLLPVDQTLDHTLSTESDHFFVCLCHATFRVELLEILEASSEFTFLPYT